MSSAAFQKLAPSARRSVLMTITFLALAFIIYILGVQPWSTKLKASQNERDVVKKRLNTAVADIKGKAGLVKRIDEVTSQHSYYIDSLLEPLHGSYAMSAKSLLDPVALETGLSELKYEEGEMRYLPIPVAVPKQLYARYSVKISCQGSYMSIVSFIMRVERDFPLVTIQSLVIQPLQGKDDQQADITFEWLVKGPTTTVTPPVVPVAPKGGKK